MSVDSTVGRTELARLQAFTGPTLVLAVLLAAGLNAFGLLAPDRGATWAGLTVWVTVAALLVARRLLRSRRAADAALAVMIGTCFPCLTGVFGVPETCVAALLGGVWALAFGVSYLNGRALALSLAIGAAVLAVNLVLAARLIDSDLPGGAGPYVLVVAALSPGGALAIVLLQLRDLRRDDRSGRSAAEEADRVKTSFLASMSHELRTPMNAVIGLAELLQDSSLDAEQRSYVETIQASGEHLLELINDVLDTTRLAAGRLAVRADEVDPVTCAEGAVEFIAPRARAKGLRLLMTTDPDVGTVVADEQRLRQVLVNLLGNAVKFTASGEVAIHLSAAGEDLQIDVTDTGPGVPAKVAATLFEPFTQMAGEDGLEHEGTGLGLPISRRLTRLMGGTLDHVPTPGAGARFRLRLPQHRAASGGDGPLSGERIAVEHPHPATAHALRLAVARLGGTPDPAAPRRLTAAPSGVPGEVPLVEDPALLTDTPPALLLPFSHARLAQVLSARAVTAGHAPDHARHPVLRVLVAEDHLVNRRVIDALLRAEGVAADLVADGREALAAVAERRYDMVLLDLHMPNLDGAGAAAAIRAQPAAAGRPWIVVSSASVLDEDRAAAFAAGADAFLPKPITRAALRQALQGARVATPNP